MVRCPVQASATNESSLEEADTGFESQQHESDPDSDIGDEQILNEDRQWVMQTGRTFPLKLPVLFISGSECCSVEIETLGVKVSHLKSQIEECIGISRCDQELLCEGGLAELKNEWRLYAYADVLAHASYLQVIRKEREEVRLCLEQLQDPDVLGRSRAAAELGKLGSSSAVPALERSLNDREWMVRQNAAMALGKFGTTAASCIPTLEQLMRSDDSPNVRMHATTALKDIGVLALPCLEKALLDEEAEEIVRIRAAEALGKLLDKAAVPALTAATQGDVSVHVRYGAAEALRAVMSKTECEPSQKERMDEYYTSLKMTCARAAKAQKVATAQQRFLNGQSEAKSCSSSISCKKARSSGTLSEGQRDPTVDECLQAMFTLAQLLTPLAAGDNAANDNSQLVAPGQRPCVQGSSMVASSAC